jgi:glutaredoxin 3
MHNITIYSTPTCGYCDVAKDWLTARNISYVEKNVAVDLEARKEMIDKSQQMGVPVFDINGSIMVGYNETKLRELLGVTAEL